MYEYVVHPIGCILSTIRAHVSALIELLFLRVLAQYTVRNSRIDRSARRGHRAA